MSKPLEINLTLPCLSEFVAIIRLMVSGIATRMNFTIEEIEDIKIAVSEACTNSVQYAYKDKKDGKLNVVCHIIDNKLDIIIKDSGKGFNLQQVEQNKKDNVNPNKFGLGLGFTFMKSLMDEVSVETDPEKGTTIHLVKYSKNQ
ncbi:MAG: anti-sigma B factor RsbW [Candidatus Margulisiibacteriota bacterium]|jgi:serine/threonine-protein kinase RsbW